MPLRPMARPEEVPAVASLIAAVTEMDGHSPLGEHKFHDLFGAESEQVAGLVKEDSRGVLAVYVAAAPTQESGTWTAEFAIRPVHRDQVEPLISEVAAWIRDAGGDRLRVWAYQSYFASALAAAGFTLERELHQLRRELPIEKSADSRDGFEIRRFEVGQDEQAWLALNNAAFEGHPENGSWDRQTLASRMDQAWFDPAALLMLWTGEELAGFCWSKMVAERTGEIYVIAVHPSRQGLGLGRFLVLEGMRIMQARFGASEVMLYVDSGNDAALRLYTDLGFRLDHVDWALVRQIG